MSGQPIRRRGAGRPGGGGIARRADGGDPRSSRPGDRLLLLAWLVLLALLAVASRGRLARQGVRVVGLAVVYLPLVLLLGAALEPGQGAEQLLSSCSARRCSPRRPCCCWAATGRWPWQRALTVVAYAVDVVAGSPLTSLSLLGPNPGLGVRFYGIGNELEALLAVLVVAGTGAALTGFAPRGLEPARGSPRSSPPGSLFAFVFAAGRFGADVGAAIVLPLGAAVAAATLAGRRPPRPAARGRRAGGRRRPAGAGRPRVAAPTPT